MAAGDAGDPLGVGEAVIVAGIGCRKGATAAEVDAALDTALERAGRPLARIDLMATAASKSGEGGIAASAAARRLRLIFVNQADLETAGARGATWSARVLALAGVPSVAEAAALAACGPKARLILPRIVVGKVTCALAESGERGEPLRWAGALGGVASCWFFSSAPGPAPPTSSPCAGGS